MNIGHDGSGVPSKPSAEGEQDDRLLSDVNVSDTKALCPRLVIAGTGADVGKTTIAIGIMAALRARGRRVASAKVGPDYIDPGYHRVATGRPGRNLDVRMSGVDMVPRLAARAGDGADLLVIEGTMGLFDGVGATDEASTAQVASLLDAPVVLVVDASNMSGSVAAVIHGFNGVLQKKFGSRLAGVILNRVESDTHEAILKEAIRETRVKVLGVFRRSQEINWRDRHLGLIPVVEQFEHVESSVKVLADLAEKHADLRSLEIIAGQAPKLRAAPPDAAHTASSSRIPIAVAGGPGFSFAYEDNLEQLEAAGAKLVVFDPRTASSLPQGVKGLYAGGGFPEEYVKEISANSTLLSDVYKKVTDGLVTWAECGGLLWLCRSLDGTAMCGVVSADASMTDRVTVGYRTATLRNRCPIAPAGALLVGHEYHYSEMSPTGSALRLSGNGGSSRGGWATQTLFASYLHLHLGADPSKAEWFVATAAGAPPPAIRERLPDTGVEGGADAINLERPRDGNGKNGNARRRGGRGSPSERNRGGGRGDSETSADAQGRLPPRHPGAGRESPRGPGSRRRPRPPRSDGHAG